MKNYPILKSFVVIIFTIISVQSLNAQTLRVFLLDAKGLAETKQKIASGDKNFNQALAKLKNDANKSLKSENFSIVNKEGTPPSGDKHDYMSQAPYFWKNPNTPNGFPYIRRAAAPHYIDEKFKTMLSKIPALDSKDKNYFVYVSHHRQF